MKRRSRIVQVALVAACCISASNATWAEDASAFPNKPINVIVTFPPGGGTDLLARLIGNYMTETLGKGAVVENRPGASGNVGARIIAERAPDGYSLLMVNSSFAINPGVFKTLPFDPKKDFEAIINIAYVPSVFVVPPDSPYQKLSDVISAAKPGKNLVSFGSCGNGTPQHLAGEMLNLQADIHMTHVPYKGCGPALNDVAGGQVGLAIITASSAMPFIKAGKLRALGLTAKERSALMPDIPTVAEQGYPGYELNQWHGFLTSAGTPIAIKNKIYEGVAQIMKRDDIQKKLADLGYLTASDGPAAFQTMVNDDIDRFSALAHKIGLSVD